VKDPELQRVDPAKRIKREYFWRRECKAHEDCSGFSTERQEKTPTSRWKLEKSNQLQWDDARVWIHGNRRRSRSWEIVKAPSAEISPRKRLFSPVFCIFRILCVVCSSKEMAKRRKIDSALKC